MGWFGDLLETIDRPSNALQGFAVDGVEGLKRGWSHEENYDFEQLIDEDLAKKAWSERNKKEKASYIFTGLANLVVDPLNAIPLGMLTKGAKAMKAGSKAGANVQSGAMKGLFSSSFPNYIPSHYGLSAEGKVVEANLKKGFLTGKGIDIPVAQQADDWIRTGVDKGGYALAKKAEGLGQTVKEGFTNYGKTLMDPEAMALYRSEGINKNMLTNPNMLSPKAKEIELVHRAFYNAHILEQSGKVGSKQVLKDFNQNLGVHGYQPYTKGSYHKLSKGYGGGIGGASKAEHTYIENHINSVWKDKGIPINRDKGKTKIFIKKGGHQDKGMGVGGRSGMHYDDITLSSMAFTDIARALGNKTPQSLDELKDILEKGTYRDSNLKFTVDKDTGNVWTSFSKKGSSITEGGVNAVVGIKPNGQFILSVSDEHNFLEALPVVGRVMKKKLPNRIIAVTPPLVDNIAKYKWKDMGVAKPANSVKAVDEIQPELPIFQMNKPAGHSWGDEIQKVTGTTANPADILYEQGRLKKKLGFAGLTTGMLGTTDYE